MPSKKNALSAPQRGMVHISTLLSAVVIALLVGLFAGSTFFSASGAKSSSAPAPQAQSGLPAPGQSDHVAQHERNVAANPDSFDEWVALGNVYYDEGDPKNAVRAYDKALALRPDSPDVLTDKGTMHRGLRQYPEALACYERAIALAPKHQHAWFNKGVVLFDMSRDDEAYAAWRKVVELNPQATLPGTGQALRDALIQAGKM